MNETSEELSEMVSKNRILISQIKEKIRIYNSDIKIAESKMDLLNHRIDAMKSKIVFIEVEKEFLSGTIKMSRNTIFELEDDMKKIETEIDDTLKKIRDEWESDT
mgnify:CR=1 FL=1